MGSLHDGVNLRRLREARGYSRREVAQRLNIHVSSLAGWEAGKRRPRENVRAGLAKLLGVDLATLFGDATGQTEPLAATLVNTLEDLPELLVELTERAQVTLRALRLSAPYSTPAFVQCEWRSLVARRLRMRTLEVQRIEIVYSLDRLKEIISNIFRYEGSAYYVKSFCPGLKEVAPAMGGYFFDDQEFLLGAYWTGVPPHNRSGIRLCGAPFRDFFMQYWDEIWRRGTLLNAKGGFDLSHARELATGLGLPASKWDQFVAEARDYEIGDGSPPFV